jgi:hypothetical protein
LASRNNSIALFVLIVTVEGALPQPVRLRHPYSLCMTQILGAGATQNFSSFRRGPLSDCWIKEKACRLSLQSWGERPATNGSRRLAVFVAIPLCQMSAARTRPTSAALTHLEHGGLVGPLKRRLEAPAGDGGDRAQLPVLIATNSGGHATPPP